MLAEKHNLARTFIKINVIIYFFNYYYYFLVQNSIFIAIFCEVLHFDIPYIEQQFIRCQNTKERECYLSLFQQLALESHKHYG